MAKTKAKGAYRGGNQSKKGSQEDPMAFKRASRVNKITSAQDAGFEGQDAFGLGDDEVNLNGRRSEDDGDFDDMDEDEVLALSLPKRSRDASDDEAGEYEEAAPAERKKPKKDRLSNRAKDMLPLESKTRTSRFQRPVASTSKLPVEDDDTASDDKASGQDDDDDSDVTAEDDDEQDEFENEWANTGGYHVTRREIARMEEQAAASGGKFTKDERDEQRDALELYEARRIQKEAKGSLDETDYLDEDEVEGSDKEVEDELTLVRADRQAKAATTQKFDTREEAIAHLLSKEPELLALLDDFSASSERLPLVSQSIDTMEAQSKGNDRPIGFAYLYKDVLATYLTLAAFYLHIRSHPSYPAVGAALASNVLARLVKVRQTISTLEDFGVVDLPGEERRKDLYNGDDEDADLEEMDRESLMARIGDLDDDELEALIAERQAMLEEEHLGSSATANGKKRKATTKAIANGDYDEEHDNEEGPRRVRKRSRQKKDKSSAHLQPVLDLSLPPVSTKGAAIVGAPNGFADDFVDATSLSAAEAAEKAGKTKSLRFYTSKIAATSARRAGAGKERGGGDDDVPYRSKERAREAALRRQQHGESLPDKETDLDAADFDEADFALAQSVNDAAPSADGYYDLVASRKKAAKHAKKEAYDDAALQERAAIADADLNDPNNPRAVNRLIMANKGLTPKRPKSVRNPRVKKRQRYEQAQKKVASMKPIYKGGLGSATYSGEKTGISSKVVKSRSL